MLSLNTIKPAKGATKKRKRVGRGNASGHGTYSTRGIKGQKARSGVSNLKRLGIRKMLLSTPKRKGFKSHKSKNQVVSLGLIDKNFKEGEKINSENLFKKGMIGDINLPIKILGNGNLQVKNLEFEGVKVSESAKEQISKAGGKIVGQ